MAEAEEMQRVAAHLDEKLYKKLLKESTRRKVNKEEGATISGVIRDALTEFFNNKKAA